MQPCGAAQPILDLALRSRDTVRSIRSMAAFINISAYTFTPLADLPALRERLLAAATAGKLKGTVLLSPEGINLFVAGLPANVEAFVRLLRSIPGLEHLTPKESRS